MEKDKEVLLKRLFAIISYSGGLIVLAAVGLMRHSAGETEGVRSFMEGLNTGLTAAVLVMIALTALRYLKALKSEEKLRALYINEHDERRLYIQSKTGGGHDHIRVFEPNGVFHAAGRAALLRGGEGSVAGVLYQKGLRINWRCAGTPAL